MSPATLIMVVLICFGCALFLAGLAVVIYQVIGLVRAGRRAGISSKEHVQEIVGRVRALQPLVQEITAKQQAVAEKLQSLSTTTNELNSLKNKAQRLAAHLPRVE